MKFSSPCSFIAVLALAVPWSPAAQEKLNALIIDGENNHKWQACTPVMKWSLEQSGRFAVAVATSSDQATWPPAFNKYAVVVLNYNGKAWSDEVRKAFLAYVGNGGGVVVVHAADNSFADWPEYNEMIGVGGWNGRDEKSGPMLRWKDGKVVRDMSPGSAGAHGANHEFVIDVREPTHPIMQGLPPRFLHASDELYSKMRGPAKNISVLATAYALPDKGGTGEHEPVFMTINWNKGRIFHTVLGHDVKSMSGVGFQVTLCRGSEWAATGKVTLPAPPETLFTTDKAATREMPAK